MRLALLEARLEAAGGSLGLPESYRAALLEKLAR
jgi:hypothetical protein